MSSPMRERSFFAELQRRNVFKASAAYLALGWVVTQITATVAPMLHLPEWVGPLVLWIGVIGFPFLVMFSWVYEITPEGIKREREVVRDDSITHITGRRLDYAIVGLMVLAVGLFVVDRFVVTPRREAARPGAAAPPAAQQASADGNPAPVAGIPDIESDPSIAVLPLVNMSDDKANEYFSDGISEELLNLLAKIPQLRVIARTSSFSFKGKDTPIPDIARTLHVASVLEGSVRKSGDKVRITAQLIRASDGSHLWSETYDRTLDDIFKVQDEIAAAVVGQLKVKLLGALPTAKPVDPKAYPLLLQGHALTGQGTGAGRKQSIALFQEVLSIAPGEASAWAGLARCYINQALYGEIPVADGQRLGIEAANKALAIDPANAMALAALGRLASDFAQDLPGAARYYERALQAEPGNLAAINGASTLLMTTGRLEDALALTRYRIAHDPANASAYYNLGLVQSGAHRWDEALEAFRDGLRLSPDLQGARSGMSTVLVLRKGDAAEAVKACEAETDELARLQCMPLALQAAGRKPDADAALKEFIDKVYETQPESVATVHAWRGEADAAFAALEHAFAMGDPGLGTVHYEPLFDPIKRDARWEPFLRRIGRAPEQVAKIEFKVALPQ